MRNPGVLGQCEEPLWTAYDVAMLDLDGVVYIGAHAVEGAAEQLARASAAGMSLAYVTNSAARPPATVARHLTQLGIPAGPKDVVTSAQAAARLLAESVSPGSPVFVIGGDGLFEALAELGLRGVQRFEDEPVAVVSGYHPELRWRTVSDGAILVRRGLPWFASNTDTSVPTPHGPGPGNGVLVGAVADFAAAVPVVAGKPEPSLFHETHRRVGGERPLVVGDRIDTDIEGAARAGYDSLLVMTGVTRLEDLVGAPRHARPTYVAATLEGLAWPQTRPAVDGLGGSTRPGWTHHGWHATVSGGVLAVSGTGTLDHWWQVVAAASWHHLDETQQPVATTGLTPSG